MHSSNSLLFFQGTLVPGTSITSSNTEWQPHHHLRISSQDALIDPVTGAGSSQLIIETGGTQFMHHDWPLPSHRTQFAGIVGGTLGRGGARPMGPPGAGLQAFPVPPPPNSTFRAGYPLYHTCERPNTSKKRVTIVEDNNTESSV